jgi:signal transduction histidine kinase
MQKTMAEISCPRCSHKMNSEVKRCENCKVDLALAAAVVENMILSASPGLHTVPVSPEVLLPRLGDYLLDKGVLDHSALNQALNLQRERAHLGHPILIGQALIELGLIERPALDEAITEQIFNLQEALRRSNQDLEQRIQERTTELQNALNKLNEINQIKSNFIANISHELRTPLTHIKGYLDLLSDGSLGPLTPNQVEALEVLDRSEKRLERIIDDLIEFTLAARGELAIETDDFQLAQLIYHTTSKLDTRLRNKYLSLQIKITDDIPPVNADEEKIGWVLMQLLENAIKFTDPGGFIEIKVRKEGEMVKTSVRDTGIGFSEKHIPEIFYPFHQLDNSTTRRYPGIGLGLSLVSRILEAHGVNLSVESKPGEGSIFTFLLPAGNMKHV